MARTTQTAVFDLTAYTGTDFSVPAHLNPSAYDIVELWAERPDADIAQRVIMRIGTRSNTWANFGGENAVFSITGLVENAVVALPVGNKGDVTTGGAFADALNEESADWIITATLAKASGDGQGQR